MPSPEEYANALSAAQKTLSETPVEGLLLSLSVDSLEELPIWRRQLTGKVGFIVWNLDGLELDPATLDSLKAGSLPGDLWMRSYTTRGDWVTLSMASEGSGVRLALAISPEKLSQVFPEDLEVAGQAVIMTLSEDAVSNSSFHPLGRYRQLAEMLHDLNLNNPVWIRNTVSTCIEWDKEDFSSRLLEASMLSGSLLCDGIGDLISVESIPSIRESTGLAYNILQGSRARTSKTEFVACPSCGRTLFDLQSTTQKIRAVTGHLKGVTIAIMGCIVNGPGEMADADFGYVGGAPGKVNLYVGKDCVQFHIPSEGAVESLVDLIRQHGKWVDPPSDA